MATTLILFAACAAIDGDTLRCGQERVRLARIDAPEMSEPAGPVARDWLKLKIEGRQVFCSVSGREKYGRLLAECWTEPGPSLSDLLLSEGVAERYRGKR